jgi:hypothetical protein
MIFSLKRSDPSQECHRQSLRRVVEQQGDLVNDDIADPVRILFGSAFPYAAPAVSHEFTDILDTQSGLTAEQSEAINAGNAKRVFPDSGRTSVDDPLPRPGPAGTRIT